MAAILLDSDICIDMLRARPRHSASIMSAIDAGEAAISVITYGEVTEGSVYSLKSGRAQLWNELVRALVVLDVTTSIADIWAEVRGRLRSLGRLVPDNDLIIAATALRFGLTLATRNVRHFSRIAQLDLLTL